MLKGTDKYKMYVPALDPENRGKIHDFSYIYIFIYIFLNKDFSSSQVIKGTSKTRQIQTLEEK